MKNILVILIAIFLVSCSENLDELNKNTKDPLEVSGESLFTTAQKEAVDQVAKQHVNWNNTRLWVQYACETQYRDETNYDLVTRSIPQGHWSRMYRYTLKNLEEAKAIITDTTYPSTENPAVKENKLQIIELMQLYSYSILVETFGDVPYEEALDIDVLNPKYDDADAVYRDLLDRLDAVIATLDPAHGSFSTGADNMYQGDVASWLKFANSLKLRMGMLYADVDNTFAQTVVEEAVADPVGLIMTADEDANYYYLSSTPNTNPDHVTLVLSGRSDYVATNTIIDMMAGLNDPRMDDYFTEASGGGYVGGVVGNQNTPAQNWSTFAASIKTPTKPGVIFDHIETEWLLAEGAERGYNVGGSTAESHYNAAITASIVHWGGTAAEATTYLAQPAVAYTTATGTWQEKIGTQRWLGLYNRGFDAWTALRRLDYPTLPVPTAAQSGFPVRYTYPVVEQTLNAAGWSGAKFGGANDLVTNRLWFDVADYSH
ncbi:SusD/RagB family nutrient-binding outer membrane lipoprotein [Reichenbachiella carrageenanivorans]|uniref:SusD/RagB family nutrient-binding outer membrane lipoprotein n=1 Tax=Reichenbachiella carrageenanivorans TaxID=2979869 RepID=A0ABY6D4W9_9BACT|nr:SusD/RagB family nutrient-binding outer membrane lipoprotein [Reichenbachiella carrageenanivorans]UXX81207.1 SusD/RagB family nutrient-binding outer membrane lipoprotein [Reichenbachiella carrageenanivorans]